MALFAEDAVSYDPVGMPPRHGRAGVREFLESLFPLTETFALTETSVLAAGNAVAVCWTGQAAGKNGRSVSFEGIDVITMDGDGKISSLYAFWDAPPVFAVLTSEGSPVESPPIGKWGKSVPVLAVAVSLEAHCRSGDRRAWMG